MSATCVICLGPFCKKRNPIKCTFCGNFLGHNKCVASFVSVVQKRCPWGCGGFIQKRETRLQALDRELYDYVKREHLVCHTNQEYMKCVLNTMEKIKGIPEAKNLEMAFLFWDAIRRNIGSLYEVLLKDEIDTYVRLIEAHKQLGVHLMTV